VKLANGTDESCSAALEQSDSCKAGVSCDSDAAGELGEPADAASHELARRNILDAAETFASIIGREIAASFDVKEGAEESPPPGDRLSAGPGSTPGLKLLGDDRRTTEADGEAALDTVEVARRVRDILTANNVGQRQFARHVLGLSQGTVSELLAKPKPWDRLTEKGKESYRRMNRWAGDHLGVLSLKDHLNSVALKSNLAPPKGSSCGTFVSLPVCSYWHCPHTMQSRVYASVGRPSCCCRFPAVGPASRRYRSRSIAARHTAARHAASECG